MVSQSSLTSFIVSLLLGSLLPKKEAFVSSAGGAAVEIRLGLGEEPVGVKLLTPGWNLNSFALTFKRALLEADVGLNVLPSRPLLGAVGGAAGKLVVNGGCCTGARPMYC